MKDYQMTNSYKKGYKEGFKIGEFIAMSNINNNMLKNSFSEEISNLKRKINWLCYYEQKLLFKLICNLKLEEKKQLEERDMNLEKKLKEEILKFLR